ncbi:protein S-acyltransferase 10-like [Musa acuminata AAA Group]|uniref:protein S-acyltransferase 10-like n=1 Tax=Musa acuminata AAA Group TaxID=214697 RepID=UPI0031E2952B
MTSVVGSSSAVRESSGWPPGRWLGRFPCLDDRATRSALCLKLILVLLHVIFGGALFILDTELRRRTREHPWYTAIYLVLYLATLVQYFFTSYSSPGYVIDVMMAGSGTHATFANLSSFDQRQITTRNKNPSPSNQIVSSVWLRQVMDLYPPGFSSRTWTCSYCHIIQPPRSKHCHDCAKCVLQFDHHCAWLGTCIGKRNHCRFWWYIFEETMLCIWTGTLYIDLLVSKAMKAWWKDLIAIILIVILVFCFIFLILLLLFHSYLALTNQTTHEIMRRRRILYLRGFPSKVHPFSKGIYRNLIAFCCSCDDKHKLEAVPPVEDVEARAQPYTCIDVISCRCC